MYTPAVEEIPEVILEYARGKEFQVITTDLEKRVRAMREIFEAPRTHLPHARKQAERLKNICIREGRGDLALELQRMIDNPGYAEKQRERQKAIDDTKKAYARELGKQGYLPFVDAHQE